jgi:hypothetical protein
VRFVAGRFFLEPSYLDIRSSRVDDVHRGLAFQVGLGARTGSIRLYGALGVKPAGESLTWAAGGLRCRVRQHLVIMPELRLGVFGSEHGYLQLAVNLGVTFGMGPN